MDFIAFMMYKAFINNTVH